MDSITVQISSEVPKVDFVDKSEDFAEILKHAGFANVITSPAIIVYQNGAGTQIVINPVQIVISSNAPVDEEYFADLLVIFAQLTSVVNYDRFSVFSILVNARYSKSGFTNMQALDGVPLGLPTDIFENCIGTGYRIAMKNPNIETAFDEFKIEPFLRDVGYVYVEMTSHNRLSEADGKLSHNIISLFEKRASEVLERLK